MKKGQSTKKVIFEKTQVKKICFRCKNKKHLEDFSPNKVNSDGRASNCKVCRNELHQLSVNKNIKKIILIEKFKEKHRKHKNIILFEKTITHKICIDCGLKKELICFSAEKHIIGGTRNSCKICRKKYNNSPARKKQRKEYLQKNKKEKSQYAKTLMQITEVKERYAKVRKENYPKHKIKSNARKRERKKNDRIFWLKCKLRLDVYRILKENGFKKNLKTEQMIGCTAEEFEKHIITQWKPWMNWDNYGKYNGELNFGWDLDHIIPLSSAKGDEEKLIKLFHYTNYQPLCSYDNRHIKRDLIIF